MWLRLLVVLRFCSGSGVASFAIAVAVLRCTTQHLDFGNYLGSALVLQTVLSHSMTSILRPGRGSPWSTCDGCCMDSAAAGLSCFATLVRPVKQHVYTVHRPWLLKFCDPCRSQSCLAAWVLAQRLSNSCACRFGEVCGACDVCAAAAKRRTEDLPRHPREREKPRERESDVRN